MPRAGGLDVLGVAQHVMAGGRQRSSWQGSGRNGDDTEIGRACPSDTHVSS